MRSRTRAGPRLGSASPRRRSRAEHLDELDLAPRPVAVAPARPLADATRLEAPTEHEDRVGGSPGRLVAELHVVGRVADEDARVLGALVILARDGPGRRR